jgi:hypothetical protein
MLFYIFFNFSRMSVKHVKVKWSFVVFHNVIVRANLFYGWRILEISANMTVFIKDICCYKYWYLFALLLTEMFVKNSDRSKINAVNNSLFSFSLSLSLSLSLLFKKTKINKLERTVHHYVMNILIVIRLRIDDYWLVQIFCNNEQIIILILILYNAFFWKQIYRISKIVLSHESVIGSIKRLNLKSICRKII